MVDQTVEDAKAELAQLVNEARTANKNPIMSLSEISSKPGVQACRPRLIMLTQDDCDPCEMMRGELAVMLGSGAIEEVAVESEEGQRIVEKNSFIATPTIALLDCDEMSVQEIFKEADATPLDSFLEQYDALPEGDFADPASTEELTTEE